MIETSHLPAAIAITAAEEASIDVGRCTRAPVASGNPPTRLVAKATVSAAQREPSSVTVRAISPSASVRA